MKKIIVAALLMIMVGTADGSTRQTTAQQQTDADFLLQAELAITKHLHSMKIKPHPDQHQHVLDVDIAQRSLALLREIKRTRLPLIAPVAILPPSLYTEHNQILRLQAPMDPVNTALALQPQKTS